MSDAQTNTATQTAAFTLDDVEKTYFSPSEIGGDRFNALAANIASTGVKPKDNLDGKDIPEGYGLLVLPISKRVNNENKTTGVAICAVPDFQHAANFTDDGGNALGRTFIENSYYNALAVKLGNAVRERKNGQAAETIPLREIEFFTTMRGGDSVKSFSKLAPLFVSALRKQGLRSITQQTLRMCLTSQPFATQQHPKVPQEAWEKVLHTMIREAEKQSLPTEVFANWLATRNETEIEDEIGSFDDLESLIAQAGNAS
jgi:hypothetical protein